MASATAAGSDRVRVGVIGLGFMGATHVAAYQAAAAAGHRCELVAVCDRKAERRAGQLWDVGGNIGSDLDARRLAFDPARVRGYASVDEILSDREIDLISVCTRTDTHADIAFRAVAARKHVLVEKPVALTVDEIVRVREAARRAGKLCMPGLCIRFWPAWRWLRDRIVDCAYGACLSATFQRLGSAPAWSGDFYNDPQRSGGALVDLHIHDADFVRYCFGDPVRVSSFGAWRKDNGAIDHLTTAYQFAAGPALVTAEGGWLTPGFPFRMRYVAHFERASADFDLGHQPQLLLCRDGKRETVPLENGELSGYDLEVRHLVDAIARGAGGAGEDELRATLDDAIAVAQLLEAERASILSGRAVEITPARNT